MITLDRIVPLEDLLRDDLDRICADLAAEFDTMAGAKLLITGGAGFLGYYLIQAALHWNKRRRQRRAIEVTVVDNYLRGLPTWLNSLAHDSNLNLVRHDVTVSAPPQLADADYIVHAAGIASPTQYRLNPLRCIDANVNGLRALLDACATRSLSKRAIRGFLFFSSSEIYGDPDASAIPTPETYRGNVSCTGPRACYDESKRFGETLCTIFAKHHGVAIAIARPFNNYGPGLKITDGRVIPDFARDVIAGRDIVLLSDGRPTRTFCYATDAITGYYKVLVRGSPGEPYNIGTESPELSIAELGRLTVETASRLLGYSGAIRFGRSNEADYLVDNPNRRCPSIDKARRTLGYEPRIGIGDGMARALIWYHFNREASGG